MSRITRERLRAGDSLTAASINDRYSDYTQTAAIDENNVRDGFVDVVHTPSSNMLINTVHSVINANSIYHTSPTIISPTTSFAAPTPVAIGQTALGSGWTITGDDVLRVYGSLQCKGHIAADPNTIGSDAALDVKDFGSSNTTNLSMATHLWVVQLQWDITSAALGAWATIPGGNNFQALFNPAAAAGRARYGAPVNELEGCAFVPAYWSGAEFWYPGGEANPTTNTLFFTTGWRNVPLTWSYMPGSNVTVYGLRMVVHGVYHPWNKAGNINGLGLDYTFGAGAATARLHHDSASISAIHMRKY